jgi:mono/diheme cytochrome c family protein
VFRSTQYLTDDDLGAIATYLGDLPQTSTRSAAHLAELAPPLRAHGEKMYRDHCADCHGRDGEGTPGTWPALAGNRAVTMTSANNPIRVVLSGGYLPATAGNPRPYGMPPFAQVLGDADVAAVLSYVRNSWGNAAAAVEPHDVTLLRQGRVN